MLGNGGKERPGADLPHHPALHACCPRRLQWFKFRSLTLLGALDGLAVGMGVGLCRPQHHQSTQLPRSVLMSFHPPYCPVEG
jgi:hypothetical protein